MKFFKISVIMIACATILSLQAKRETKKTSSIVTEQANQKVVVPANKPVAKRATRNTAAAQAKRTPSKSSAVEQKQEAPATQSFHQIRAKIVSNKTPNAIIDKKTGMLQPKFINDIVEQVKAAELGPDGIVVLLQTARDLHAPFTNDNAANMRIINNTNAQISKALGDYLKN